MLICGNECNNLNYVGCGWTGLGLGDLNHLMGRGEGGEKVDVVGNGGVWKMGGKEDGMKAMEGGYGGGGDFCIPELYCSEARC